MPANPNDIESRIKALTAPSGSKPSLASSIGAVAGKSVDDADRMRVDQAKNMLVKLLQMSGRRLENAGLGLADVNPRDHRLADAMRDSAAKNAEAIVFQGFLDKCAELDVDPVRLVKLAQNISGLVNDKTVGMAKSTGQALLGEDPVKGVKDYFSGVHAAGMNNLRNVPKNLGTGLTGGLGRDSAAAPENAIAAGINNTPTYRAKPTEVEKGEFQAKARNNPNYIKQHPLKQ